MAPRVPDTIMGLRDVEPISQPSERDEPIKQFLRRSYTCSSGSFEVLILAVLFLVCCYWFDRIFACSLDKRPQLLSQPVKIYFVEQAGVCES